MIGGTITMKKQYSTPEWSVIAIEEMDILTVSKPDEAFDGEDLIIH